jgi:hypothetical protein
MSIIDNERAEQRAARDDVRNMADDDRPTRSDLAESYGPDPYAGTCGGCGQYVSASMQGGSCIWRGGPWHPACRAKDKRAGGTWRYDTAPPELQRMQAGR